MLGVWETRRRDKVPAVEPLLPFINARKKHVFKMSVKSLCVGIPNINHYLLPVIQFAQLVSLADILFKHYRD